MIMQTDSKIIDSNAGLARVLMHWTRQLPSRSLAYMFKNIVNTLYETIFAPALFHIVQHIVFLYILSSMICFSPHLNLIGRMIVFLHF